MGHKILLEKEFGVGFISILPSGSRSNPKRNLWQPYFIEVPAFSQIREVLREFGFFFPLHLLNLKSLQLKIIFIPTLGFPVGPHSYNEYRWLKLHLGVIVSEKYTCGMLLYFKENSSFALKTAVLRVLLVYWGGECPPKLFILFNLVEDPKGVVCCCCFSGF